jgi:hypothetical protein
MVATSEVLKQFARLHVKPSYFARAEIKELANILVPGEQLTHVVFGWYENGFALLCCTEHRVLLIDKKPLFLKLEDLRYDRITEVKYLNRLLDSTLILSYTGMTLEFKTWNHVHLRNLINYIQQAITIINQQQWRLQPNYILAPEEPQPQPTVHAPIKEIDDAQYESNNQDTIAYPDDLMRSANVELGLMKNPYAPTTKILRRRIPLLGFETPQR